MTECKFATIKADCSCVACVERYETAKLLVARNADIRDLRYDIRPFVLKAREQLRGKPASVDTKVR